LKFGKEKSFLMLRDYLKAVYGLDDNETDALLGQIGHQGKPLTRKILQRRCNDAEAKNIVNLDMALSKLPLTKERTLFRNDNFNSTRNAIDFFKSNIGNVVQFEIYLSTTKLRYFAGNDDPYDVVMQITPLVQSTMGIDIESLYLANGVSNLEKEVLFKRNCCFEVKSVQDVKPQVNLKRLNVCQLLLQFLTYD